MKKKNNNPLLALFVAVIILLTAIPGANLVISAVDDNIFYVSGEVQSYNPKNTVTVQLLQNGELKCETTINAAEGSGQTTQVFTLHGVAEGVYTMVVTKTEHTKFTVTNFIVDKNIEMVDLENPTLQVITLLCGDINNDGVINASDLAILTSSVNYMKSASEANDWRADLNGDGVINASDLAILTNSVNYMKGEVKTTIFNGIYYAPSEYAVVIEQTDDNTWQVIDAKTGLSKQILIATVNGNKTTAITKGDRLRLVSQTYEAAWNVVCDYDDNFAQNKDQNSTGGKAKEYTFENQCIPFPGSAMNKNFLNISGELVFIKQNSFTTIAEPENRAIIGSETRLIIYTDDNQYKNPNIGTAVVIKGTSQIVIYLNSILDKPGIEYDLKVVAALPVPGEEYLNDGNPATPGEAMYIFLKTTKEWNSMTAIAASSAIAQTGTNKDLTDCAVSPVGAIITYSLFDSGETGATVIDGIFRATNPGMAIIRAETNPDDYANFYVYVNDPPLPMDIYGLVSTHHVHCFAGNAISESNQINYRAGQLMAYNQKTGVLETIEVCWPESESAVLLERGAFAVVIENEMRFDDKTSINRPVIRLVDTDGAVRSAATDNLTLATSADIKRKLLDNNKVVRVVGEITIYINGIIMVLSDTGNPEYSDPFTLDLKSLENKFNFIMRDSTGIYRMMNGDGDYSIDGNWWYGNLSNQNFEEFREAAKKAEGNLYAVVYAVADTYFPIILSVTIVIDFTGS